MALLTPGINMFSVIQSQVDRCSHFSIMRLILATSVQILLLPTFIIYNSKEVKRHLEEYVRPLTEAYIEAGKCVCTCQHCSQVT